MNIPREGSRDTSEGIIVSLTPDVCKTPVGSSLVPIPYSITAIQGDDANTAATVRYGKLRAHNMASLTTQCTGDAPGTGTGIKSGTIGSICEPKSHSGSVRVQGEWAVRNNDEWWMNNRNTIGKLTYIKTQETFEPTPAVVLTQNAASLVPAGEQPSLAVQAMLNGMARAAADPFPAGSYLVAEATGLTATDAVPGTPDSTSGGGVSDRLRDLSRNPTLNRIARHPATKVLLQILQDATMTEAEKDLTGKAMRVFFSPVAQDIAADTDLRWGGMPAFNPFSASDWSDDMLTGSKYGAFITDAEKLGMANDVLSHAAGRPVDIRTTSQAEIDRILGDYAAMQEEETRADAGTTADNVRVEGKAAEIDCFEIPPGVDPEEFKRQLKEQQDQINNSDIDQLMQRRQTFRDGNTKRDRRAQRQARRDWIKNRRTQLMDQQGLSATAAEAAAQTEALVLDATHALDMIAGGDPSNISGLGNSSINRSIGSQWRGRRVAQLDAKLDEQKQQGRTRPQIELKACD